MPKRESRELVRKHLWLYVEDWNRIETLYGGKVKPSAAVRRIVHHYLNRIEDAAAQSSKPISQLEILEEDGVEI